MEHENWIWIERIHHEYKVVNRRDQYMKVLISRRGVQTIRKHKLDFFEFFAKKSEIVWEEWKTELEIY